MLRPMRISRGICTTNSPRQISTSCMRRPQRSQISPLAQNITGSSLLVLCQNAAPRSSSIFPVTTPRRGYAKKKEAKDDDAEGDAKKVKINKSKQQDEEEEDVGDASAGVEEKAPHPFDRMEKLLQAFKEAQSASSSEEPAAPAAEKLTPAQIGYKAKQFYDKALKLLEVEKYTEAENLLNSSYTLRKKIYEPHNIDLINTMLQLAHARQNLGNKESALQLYEAAIGEQKKKLGDDSLHVGLALFNYAEALAMDEQVSEAEVACKDALAIFKKNLGEEHEYVAAALSNLMSYVATAGRLEEALSLGNGALFLLEKRLGPGAEYRNLNVLKLLSDLGRSEEAEKVADAWRKKGVENIPLWDDSEAQKFMPTPEEENKYVEELEKTLPKENTAFNPEGMVKKPTMVKDELIRFWDYAKSLGVHTDASLQNMLMDDLEHAELLSKTDRSMLMKTPAVERADLLVEKFKSLTTDEAVKIAYNVLPYEAQERELNTAVRRSIAELEALEKQKQAAKADAEGAVPDAI